MCCIGGDEGVMVIGLAAENGDTHGLNSAVFQGELAICG
jgi:hypothetical protein